VGWYPESGLEWDNLVFGSEIGRNKEDSGTDDDEEEEDFVYMARTFM